MRLRKLTIGALWLLFTVAGFSLAQSPTPPSSADSVSKCGRGAPPPAMHWVCPPDNSCNCYLVDELPSRRNAKTTHPDETPHSPCSEWVERFVAPVYPPLARTARIMGSVFVKVELDGNGNVMTADVIEGHPLLRQSALDAVKKWKFSSFGNSVETVQVKFTISGDPKEDPPGVIITPPDEIEIVVESPVLGTTNSYTTKAKKHQTPKKR